MDMMSSDHWNPQNQNSGEEFAFNLGMPMDNSMDFNFSPLPNAADQLDATMTGLDHMPNTTVGISQSTMAITTGAITTSSIPAQMTPNSMISPSQLNIISELDAKIQYLQQQRDDHQKRQMLQEQNRNRHSHVMNSYFSPNPVPPTPQSLELAAGNMNQFYHPSDTPQFNNQFSNVQDDLFTPLVSPAVTPMEQQQYVDNHFNSIIHCFSPLTSPALHAQPDPMMTDMHQPTGNSHSPIDQTEQWTATGLSEQSSKKTHKSTGKTTRAKSGIRQSPIAKAQRRRGTVAGAAASNSSLATQALNEAEEDAAQKSSSYSADSEENVSVSPEALNDMPPPPVPQAKSTNVLPFVAPRNSRSESSKQSAPRSRPVPATPASLMRLSNSGKASASTSPVSMIPTATIPSPVDSLQLLESAAFEDGLGSPALDTPMQGVVDAAPITKNIAPLPSPVVAKTSWGSPSATQSPQILPSGSSSSVRKTPQLSARSSKRSGSIHVSPALLPKISPNIKPLLPTGAEDAAQRLLTVKSNYQNLIEGNNVPGVNYPSELSTNLTSKRTSHKLAEQGRRDRINSALAVMATLLPNAPTGYSDSGEKKGKQSATTSSKASTVEQAIVYIRKMQEELAQSQKRVQELENRLKEKSRGEAENDVLATDFTVASEEIATEAMKLKDSAEVS